jgi:hypothetical protein
MHEPFESAPGHRGVASAGNGALDTFKKMFTEHPRSVGETYFEHMGSAFAFGHRMVFAGFACLMHGVFPFLFVKTGSSTIRHLHDSMITHRSRLRAAPEWHDQGAFI